MPATDHLSNLRWKLFCTQFAAASLRLRGLKPLYRVPPGEISQRRTTPPVPACEQHSIQGKMTHPFMTERSLKRLQFPQRHRGGSPFFQQMPTKRAVRMMTAEKNGVASTSGEKTKPLTAIKVRYAIKTTHPCQVAGNPHPHPYRFAGNQYFGVSDIGVSFRFQADRTEASRLVPGSPLVRPV